ncbi:MAG: class I SAM-dependent methyltransferase [Myxococcales bacterium]|nr:class I SAM-dependent methyltransferase [Myxococcales bacterium]
MHDSTFSAALQRRRDWLDAWHSEGTDIYRLLHGAVEGAPGVAVDRYGPILLVQTWREPLAEGALQEWVEQAGQAVGAELTGVWNHREKPIDFERWFPLDALDAHGHELGLQFDVRPRHRGQDPLLFVDLRSVRRRIRGAVAGKRVLNLFAYTCGVGLAAAAGGAQDVLNVDWAGSALAVGRHNAERNDVPDVQRFLEEDCLAAMRQLGGLPVGGRRGKRGRFTRLAPDAFDLVVLDPPRWSTSRFGAVDVVRDYPGLFKPALCCTVPGGTVVATNHVPSVDLDDWLEVLQRCARKAGRPLAEVEVMTPEADVPSPDGRPPLKVAWCTTAAG